MTESTVSPSPSTAVILIDLNGTLCRIMALDDESSYAERARKHGWQAIACNTPTQHLQHAQDYGLLPLVAESEHKLFNNNVCALHA